MNELLTFWKAEEAAALSGWDFSHIRGRFIKKELPWSYEKWLREFLKKDTQLLDMGTGVGEFLLGLGHPYALTSVTEAWEPNHRLCMSRLAPLGIRVEQSWDHKPLPFEDESFDLVINRHEFYNPVEVRRVLKKGGHFVTQQVGAQNSLLLSRRLGLEYSPSNPSFNLENQAEVLKKSGFKVVRRDQCYSEARFADLGALCYFAKLLPWEYPDFSVEKCKDQLFSLQRELEGQGFISLGEHRFIMVAKKI